MSGRECPGINHLLMRATLLAAALGFVPGLVAADVAALVAQGALAAGDGNAEEAGRLLARARAEAPKDPGVSYLTGRVAMLDEDFGGAIKLFDRARELTPGNATYHLWSGNAHIEKLQRVGMLSKRGLAMKAIERFIKAVEIAPRDPEARESLAQYYLQAPGIAGGSKEKGLEQVEALRTIDPIEASNVLGGYYEQKKMYAEAEKEFAAAVAAAPRDARAHYGYGRYKQSREEFGAAFESFEEAARLSAASDQRRIRRIHTAALYQIGRTAALSGDHLDRGATQLGAYLKIPPAPGQPSWSNAHWRLGMIREHQGRTVDARAAYETALKLDAGNDEARKALKRLK